MTPPAPESQQSSKVDRDSFFEARLAELRAEEARPVAHFVAGAASAEGEVHWREDPSDPAVIASGYHEAPAELVRRAVAAAREAQPAWDALGPARRAELLRGGLALLDEERLGTIAATISLETGKTRGESYKEAEELKVLLERYCDIGSDPGSFSEPLEPDSDPIVSESVLRPFGVFGVISPFNYPAVQGAGPAIAALVAGNTVVMKPPHQGPRSAATFVDLLAECDLPAGVVNMVHGEDEPGKALVAADIDGVAFTGSYAAGMAIYRAMQSGPYVRPVIAEMGGNSPVVVTASADLDLAAEAIARSAFSLTGQRCNATRRAVVVAEVHDELVERIARRAGEMVVGDPADPETFIGPLIDPGVVERYAEVVERAGADGTVVCGGETLSRPGYFVRPTVIADLPTGHPLTRTEHFMPLLTVAKVSDFDEAVEVANATELGLAAGIYTGDGEEAGEFVRRVEAGCVNVNVPGNGTTHFWPGNQTFGGWKGSGSTGKQAFGRWYVQQFGRERCQSVGAGFEL